MAYTENKPTYSARFMKFDDKKPTILVISDWTTEKIGDVLFKCYVTEQDGEVVDKILTAFDFDFAEGLKKAIRGKKSLHKLKIQVTMDQIDEFDREYEVKLVK